MAEEPPIGVADGLHASRVSRLVGSMGCSRSAVQRKRALRECATMKMRTASWRLKNVFTGRPLVMRCVAGCVHGGDADPVDARANA